MRFPKDQPPGQVPVNQQGMTMRFNCAQCGKETDRPAGHVNRARAQGMNLYCSRECSGLGRRVEKSADQRKEEKRLYDMEYRQRNTEERKAKKAEYYKRTRDPMKEAEKRKERMSLHVEYCRRPEYRAWKKSYDRKHRAEKQYGEFADCFLLAMDIRDECLSRMTDYEIRVEKGTINKALKRKRNDIRTYSNASEIGPLGNLERGQRR
jgi:lipopolysaccharide assembly outer membrane protein LptD (OstA)